MHISDRPVRALLHRAVLSFALVFVAARAFTQPAPRNGSSSGAESSQPVPSNPLLGAVRHAELVAQPIALSFQSALEQGLQYNIGLLLSSKTTEQARSARLAQLSELLPQVSASLRESRQKTNLEAFGISFPGVPKTTEVTNSDARATFSSAIVDLRALSNTRAATANVKAAEWDYRNTREAVTLAIATTYLQTVSAEAALLSAQADLRTAQALYQLASDREKAGLSPNIDTLRAQVEMQARQQAVTQAQNLVDKQRVALLRIVGLPLNQEVAITSRVPYKPTPDVAPVDAFARALMTRADYQSAEAQRRAAELTKRGAELERLPTLTVTGDYGALGTTPSNTLSTWSASGIVRVPVFEGGRIHAAILQTSAALEQRQAELADLRTAIEQEVTNALLDVRAAAQQVDVATTTVDYAQQALMQAQDRFGAGVTNNIEVIQAQEALVNANNQYISALHSHNIAKVMLARATGSAEATVKDVLAIDPTPAPPQPR
jgi:outer membrane protein TolC